MELGESKSPPFEGRAYWRILDLQVNFFIQAQLEFG